MSRVCGGEGVVLMPKKVVTNPAAAMTPADLSTHIQARRKDLDERIERGEVERKRPLTYDKKGPSIRGGAEGWKPEHP